MFAYKVLVHRDMTDNTEPTSFHSTQLFATPGLPHVSPSSYNYTSNNHVIVYMDSKI